MREIKFRGKSPCFNTWLYGDLVRAEGIPCICEKGSMEMDGHHIRQFADRPQYVREDTIGQFTGIKDNKGNEIYEGDIIRFKYEDYSEYSYNGYHHPVEVISVVTFEWGSYKIDGYPCRLGACCDWAEDECEFEVIGNIYDKPELLKKN